MNKREAKIIALKTLAGSINVLINDVDFRLDEKGNVTRTGEDVEKIISELDIIASQLNERAERLLVNGK
jgi:hypothetical protein